MCRGAHLRRPGSTQLSCDRVVLGLSQHPGGNLIAPWVRFGANSVLLAGNGLGLTGAESLLSLLLLTTALGLLAARSRGSCRLALSKSSRLRLCVSQAGAKVRLPTNQAARYFGTAHRCNVRALELVVGKEILFGNAAGCRLAMRETCLIHLRYHPRHR